MDKIFLRNLSMREILAMTSRTSVRLSAVQTVGVEVGRNENLWGWECSGNFPWRVVTWKRCIWQPAFLWRGIILVTSNGIKSRKVEEKRKSMREEATKFEKFKRRKHQKKLKKEKKRNFQ